MIRSPSASTSTREPSRSPARRATPLGMRSPRLLPQRATCTCILDAPSVYRIYIAYPINCVELGAIWHIIQYRRLEEAPAPPSCRCAARVTPVTILAPFLTASAMCASTCDRLRVNERTDHRHVIPPGVANYERDD